MDTAISRLLKVLSLEKKQGYRNKAVIGGLDKFVSRWEVDARAEVGSNTAINEIIALLLGYPAIDDPTARERILEQVVRRAREIDSAAAVGGGPDAGTAEPKPAPRPESQPEPPAAYEPEREPPARDPEEARGEKPRERSPEGYRPAASKPAAFMPPEARSAPPPPPPAEVRRPPAARAEPPPIVPQQPAPPARPTPRPRDSEEEYTQFESFPPAARDVPGDHAETEEVSRPVRASRQPLPGFGLEAPVTRLPNVGPSFAQKLAKLGVVTIRDLLYLLPNRYDDFSELRTIDRLRYGEIVTVMGTVWNIKTRVIGEERRVVTAVVGDGTGEMEMTWFNPYVEKQLRVGFAYSFSGKIDSYRGVLTMRHPEFEALDRNQLNTGRLVPVYPLTEGLSNPWLRKLMRSAVEAWGAGLPDFLPQTIREGASLLPLSEALTQIHFPDSKDLLAAAHRRLSFDEFLILQLGVLGTRSQVRDRVARQLRVEDGIVDTFCGSLPFSMTSAQHRALREIVSDLASEHPMARLLQGDVGSGKTAVAAAGLWVAVANGAQGAIMAPTEILAEQHARTFGRMFETLTHPLHERPIRVVLLTGSMRAAEREEALAALSAGDADIAVGTHALIQQAATFRDLAFTVVDEQHRFGVEQRAALRSKGEQPHMLVMSATPIPRSLALTIYGDLDISVIDEMPAGRTPIKTKWLMSSQRERAYEFVRRQVKAGRQAFIVYPLVEESETTDAKAAVEEHARLSSVVFPDARLGLLHGRLKGEEKDSVMQAFRAGELDVLVATSVVEVGIDVPNATVIIIEGAERFGLAQLHQFRGRVGRGEYPSYCILVSDVGDGEGVKRLQALESNTDGFALAQIDLELRGPGDFFGTRQSGLPPLQTAQLSDLRTLEEARAAAQQLFAADPTLSLPEHSAIAAQVTRFWQAASETS
jgi:ATP-dependent DNA helicase RecG